MWKYLKVAVTAVSLLVCVLLMALWVRSYTYADFVSVGIPNSLRLSSHSANGKIEVMLSRDFGDGFSHSQWGSWEDSGMLCVERKKEVSGIWAPHWFLITITATIAALPWIKWHFSLRTLLIAMTLLALFFGAIAISL